MRGWQCRIYDSPQMLHLLNVDDPRQGYRAEYAVRHDHLVSTWRQPMGTSAPPLYSDYLLSLCCKSLVLKLDMVLRLKMIICDFLFSDILIAAVHLFFFSLDFSCEEFNP